MPKKGYKQTDEHKGNISLGNKGNTNCGVPKDGSKNPSWFKIGHNIPKEWQKKNSEYHKNVHYSETTNLKRSLALKGKPKTPEHIAKLSGPNHWNWQGGKSNGPNLRQTEEYDEWRRAVYKRDAYTCQDCGKRFKEIVAHHLKSFADFPELRYIVENGTTLCRIMSFKKTCRYWCNH